MNIQSSVLLIDPDFEHAETLAYGFQSAGYFVGIVPTPLEALNCLKEHLFQLAIFHPSASIEEELGLVCMLRRLYPNLKVLVLSSDGSTDKILKAFRWGARGYLLLPVSSEQVMTCARLLLAERPPPSGRGVIKASRRKIRPARGDDFEDN